MCVGLVLMWMYLAFLLHENVYILERSLERFQRVFFFTWASEQKVDDMKEEKYG